jgi:hypothetical protein
VMSLCCHGVIWRHLVEVGSHHRAVYCCFATKIWDHSLGAETQPDPCAWCSSMQALWSIGGDRRIDGGDISSFVTG